MSSGKERSPAGFEGRASYVKAPERDSVADTSSVGGLVTEILQSVRASGDAAIREYSQRFDKVTLERLEVSAAERRAAVDALAAQTRADTEFAIENVRRFARAQLDTIRSLET